MKYRIYKKLFGNTNMNLLHTNFRSRNHSNDFELLIKFYSPPSFIRQMNFDFKINNIYLLKI